MTQELGITNPVSGDFFASDEAITIAWPHELGSVVVTMTTSRPQYPFDLSNAVWQAFLTPGSDGVSWQEGTVLTQKGWGPPTPPDSLPFGARYIVAAAYIGTTLTRVSRIVSINVGEDWPAVGSSCDPSESDTPCWVPTSTQECVAGVCQQVCNSHLDCVGVADGRCGDLVDGLRFCGIHLEQPDGGTDSGSDSLLRD